MTPMGWDRLNIAEMIINSVVATLWAFAAWDIARRHDRLTWPLPWRWVSSNWFWGKAALYWAITISLVITLTFLVGEVVLNVFTIVHIWAFWRWLHLPVEGDAPPCADDGPCPPRTR